LILVDTRSAGEPADTIKGVEFFAFADGVVSIAELLSTQTRNPGPRAPATVFGTAADDRLVSGASDDVIDGLGGRDWLDLTDAGSRGADVKVLSESSVSVARAGGTDALYNTEEVRFLDGRVVFDLADPAAQVVRLYEAALDRVPDQGGFNYWVDLLQSGYPLSFLADAFLGSPEFRDRFGDDTTSNEAFVDRLYNNILGRAGEAEGRAYWMDALESGIGRSEVLTAFSESPENKTGTAAFIRTGVWDRDETAAEVARLYDTVLGRKPDLPGLAYWKNAIEGGALDLAQVTDSFTASNEFRSTYGDLDNRRFVQELYRNALDREAEQGGLDAWTSSLNAGTARSAVVLAFSESAEHIALTASDIQSDVPEQFGILFV
jgi:Domain of unknown function (DUF4214)